MHEFSQEQLQQIALDSEKNVQTIWNMFGLDAPQPPINAGVAWAVMTAALAGGWVVEIEDHRETLLLAVEKVKAELHAENEDEGDEQVEASTDDELLNIDTLSSSFGPSMADGAGRQNIDVYHLGFLQGKEAASVPSKRNGTRLVTISESDGQLVAEGDPARASSEVESQPAAPRNEQDDGVLVGVEQGIRAVMAELREPESKPEPTLDPTNGRFASGEQRQQALHEVINALRDMATGNVMPTPEAYDKSKPAGLPTAEMVRLRFDIDWPTLAHYAKLEMMRRGRPPKK